MKKKLLTILFLLSAIYVNADNGRLYSVRERLSSSTISCITQDHYGFIWVGTENGLNRFDGYRFTNYLSDAAAENTLNDNEVTCLFNDDDHRMWIGSNEGLSRYEYKNNSFVRYVFPDKVRPRVETMVQDEDGNIIIGTSGYGLYVISHGTDTLVRLSAFTKQRSDEFVNRCYLDANKRLWRFAFVPSVSRVTYTNKKNGRPSLTAVKNFALQYGPAVGMINEADGNFLLICTHGILKYNNVKSEFADAGYDLSALDRNVSIHRALRDSNGNLYIGTLGKGLWVIPKGQLAMRPYEAKRLPFDLNSANVNDIFEDKNHNLWVGCYKKGLLQLGRRPAVFHTWSLAEQGYKLGSGVSSLALGNDGDAWCIVQKAGVYHLDAEGKVISRQPAPDGSNVIYRDYHGSYWLGTETALYSYQPITGTATHILDMDGWGVNCIVEDNDGTLFVSNFGKGLTIYNQSTRETKIYNMYQRDARKGNLCNDWIKSLHVDSRGLLWIGTTDGVSCMNPNDGNFKVLGWNVQMKSIQCYTMCEQADGNMLFGTNMGLYIYYRKQNKIEIFPGAEKLRGKPIYNLLFDANGVLWLTMVDGIWYKDRKSNDFIGISSGNGLIRTEFTPNTAFRAANGQIVFGCTEGLVNFLPSGVLSSSVQPGQVFLTGMSVNGKAVDLMQGTYVLPWDENTLTMEFSLLDYSNPEAVTFQYCLIGDKEWISLPEGTNTLSLMRLKPGTYDIKVRAIVGGVCSDKLLTVKVRIKAPWYASSIAYAIYGLLAIGLVAMVFYLIDRRRQRQLEEEKMRFLLNLKKEVKSALKPVNVKGNNKALLDRIMKSVNENLSNPDFNVEQLAQDVGVSRAQLHRKMKEMTGVSTGDFIRNLRLDQAAALIVEGKVNVTQVAYSVGFNNQSHFSTIFRKHFGLTPSEYAVVHRKENEN